MNKKMVYYLVAGTVIFFCGVYVGHLNVEKPQPDMYSLHDQGVVVELKGELKLLRLLRNGEIARSEEMLENFVDNNVVYFDGKIRRNEVNKLVKKEIIEVIKQAKKYREEFPEHQPVEAFSKSVEDAFRNVGE